MALIPISIPPGVYRNGTELQSTGRWYDSNLVRWFQGTMRPIGGWAQRSSSAVTGAARGLITWRDNAGDRWIGIGTHSNLYVMNEAGDLSDITPSGFSTGFADPTANLAYGGGFYGAEAYGIARSDSVSYEDATTWSMDTWGEYLVACSSYDGKLYEWTLDFATPTPAAVITNAPTSNAGVLVTAERFMFALGAGGDVRKVAWSDQENNTVWTSADTNQAGDFILNTVGTIMAGKRFRGVSLIWTSVDLHVAQYVGQPFVYGFEKAGSGCGLISRQSVAVTDNAAIWMSRSGFFLYDGYVRPLPSDVSDYVYREMNMDHVSKVYAVHNSAFGEVWWFYVGADSTEINRYVTFNYRENHWSIGELSRTAGTDVNVFNSPIMVSTDGYVYDHEVGFVSGTVYAETGPFQIGNGDTVMMAREVVPDELTRGGVTASFSTKFYPNASGYAHGPYDLNSPTSVRFTGRQVKMKIEQSSTPSDWRVGTMRVDVAPGGRR